MVAAGNSQQAALNRTCHRRQLLPPHSVFYKVGIVADLSSHIFFHDDTHLSTDVHKGTD